MHSELVRDVCLFAHISQHYCIGFCSHPAIGKCQIVAASELSENLTGNFKAHIITLLGNIFLDKDSGLVIAFSLSRNLARHRLVMAKEHLHLIIIREGGAHRDARSLFASDQLDSGQQ